MHWLPAIIAYALGLLIAVYFKRRQLAGDPYKAARFRVVPLHYKLVCCLVVVPLFSAAPVALIYPLGHGAIALLPWVLGYAAHVGLEIACVPVYRRHGLWI